MMVTTCYNIYYTLYDNIYILYLYIYIYLQLPCNPCMQNFGLWILGYVNMILSDTKCI